MSNFKAMAAGLESQWKDAEAPKGEYKNLPDAKYLVNIESQSIEMNNRDKWELKLTFKVVSEPHTGRLIWKRYDLENPERFGFLKQDLEKITGMKLEVLSQLEDFAPTLVNRVIEVTLKTSTPNDDGKTYQNCYVGKFVSMDVLTKVVAGVNLDDLPF